jgi:hypothetical protein
MSMTVDQAAAVGAEAMRRELVALLEWCAGCAQSRSPCQRVLRRTARVLQSPGLRDALAHVYNAGTDKKKEEAANG